MQIWSRFGRIFHLPGILFTCLAVYAMLEVFHTANFAAELLARFPEAVDHHPGWTMILSVAFLAFVIVWPDLKTKYPNLRLLPRSLDERFQELHDVVMTPKTGHCDRIDAVESRLSTDFATVDVVNRDREVAIAALNAVQLRTAGIDTFLNAPASIFGTLWITINPPSPYIGVEESGFTYTCNCLNVGGMPCTITKILVHLDHASFEQNAEDAITDQQLVKTSPLGKFERSGLIKVPLVSADKLRQARFENARLIDDSGRYHYVDARVSEACIAKLDTLRGDLEKAKESWRNELRNLSRAAFEVYQGVSVFAGIQGDLSVLLFRAGFIIHKFELAITKYLSVPSPPPWRAGDSDDPIEIEWINFLKWHRTECIGFASRLQIPHSDIFGVKLYEYLNRSYNSMGYEDWRSALHAHISTLIEMRLNHAVSWSAPFATALKEAIS